MADNKPTLHYLENSQAHLTLWLLEELGIEYNLVKHPRVKNRAPPSLFAVHPIGKSPTLVTPTGRVLTERSAIALWLIGAYDEGAKFRVPTPTSPTTNSNSNSKSGSGSGDGGGGGNEDDAVREEQLISLGGATLCPMLTLKLVLTLTVKQSPFVVRALPALVAHFVDRVFLDAELDKLFGYLDAQLAPPTPTPDARDGGGGGGEGERMWFLGTREPTRTDFSLMWYVDWAVQWKWIDMAKFPRLKAFHDRCTARPAWKRALEKGYGYNLAFW